MTEATDVQRWLARRSWNRPPWTADALVSHKAGRTVSVVLPALNEQDTVADVVASIRPLLGTLVDELVVLDSGSTDATVERARAAGADVIFTDSADDTAGGDTDKTDATPAIDRYRIYKFPSGTFTDITTKQAANGSATKRSDAFLCAHVLSLTGWQQQGQGQRGEERFTDHVKPLSSMLQE